ncbi:hypothetical protein FACS189465_0150 [Clostridia bacterium]|nr:hypothetical protein FACS189465_0150 [Clostridia bacterium]
MNKFNKKIAKGLTLLYLATVSFQALPILAVNTLKKEKNKIYLKNHHQKASKKTSSGRFLKIVRRYGKYLTIPIVGALLIGGTIWACTGGRDEEQNADGPIGKKPKEQPKNLEKIFEETAEKTKELFTLNPSHYKESSTIFALEDAKQKDDTVISLDDYEIRNKNSENNKNGEIVVENGRSIHVTSNLPEIKSCLTNSLPLPKIAILNFANYYHVGGGVVRGAQAQEEDLCRVSDLYEHLEQKEVQFHNANQSNEKNYCKKNGVPVIRNSNGGVYGWFGGNRGIYTKDVWQLRPDIVFAMITYWVRIRINFNHNTFTVIG